LEDGFEDMYRRVPDTTKVRELIDWQAIRSLDEIILDVAGHQRGTPSPATIGAGEPFTASPVCRAAVYRAWYVEG
jgi:hypothetical protein